jgi:ribosomal protein S18 acetylase RimI-like enzyme
MVTETLRWRGGWARIAPLPDSGSRGSGSSHERGSGSESSPDAVVAAVAHLTVGTDTPPPSEAVERCLARLRRAGYGEVITNALSPADSLPFVDAGFSVRERLHLLAHDLTAVATPARPSRRARQADRDLVLRLDARAFAPSWRLAGQGGLVDALRATQVARFRVAESRATEGATTQGNDIVGYAISGRAGDEGYLQRVAVDPDAQGQGWGRALVVDGLQWLRRRGAARALVNTQLANAAALSLYESCGFRRLPIGLCVLGRPL